MNRIIRPSSLDLLEHRLQAVLKLAAKLCPANKGAHVERDDVIVLEPFRHVARRECGGPSPSTIAVLPTPG